MPMMGTMFLRVITAREQLDQGWLAPSGAIPLSASKIALISARTVLSLIEGRKDLTLAAFSASAFLVKRSTTSYQPSNESIESRGIFGPKPRPGEHEVECIESVGSIRLLWL